MAYQLGIKLEGDAATPGTIRSSEIATTIMEYEKMVISLIQAQNPTLNLREKDIIVGLKDLLPGSSDFRFSTSHPGQAQAALMPIETALKTGEFSLLPKTVRKSLVTLQSVARNYNGSFTFADWQDGQHRVLGKLSGDAKIPVAVKKIKSGDTLYGVVIRIGGEDPPRAILRFPNEGHLSCRITRRGGRQIARELGRRLYQMVSVTGIAERDSEDMSLVEFTIHSIGTYEEKSAEDTMQRLANILTPFIEEIGGSEQYLIQARDFDEVDD